MILTIIVDELYLHETVIVHPLQPLSINALPNKCETKRHIPHVVKSSINLPQRVYGFQME